jgi:hypothetical protein
MASSADALLELSRATICIRSTEDRESELRAYLVLARGLQVRQMRNLGPSGALDAEPDDANVDGWHCELAVAVQEVSHPS